jgi:hypothetical protein
MKEFLAAVVALVTAGAVLLVLGIAVCGLAIATESGIVALVGAGVGIPFAIYIGYLAARAVLR